MSEPYLICHLVRDEPAFDVAIKLLIGDESGWIIPTSGHRAYPYWACQLMTESVPVLHNPIIPSHPFILLGADMEIPPPPPNWPDHYSSTPAPKGQGRGLNLASILNLIPRSTIRRR